MTSIKSYTLKDGSKRYKFQVYLGIDPLTRKERRTTRRGFKTKKEAQLVLSRLQLEIDKGTYRKQSVETYGEIYDLWVEQYKRTVEDSTFVKTTNIFKNHILPKFALYKIEKINIELCQQAVNEWSDILKKYRTVKSYASKVFYFALKRGYIEKNPMNLVETPNVKESTTKEKIENFYSREELILFLNCLEKENNYKAYTFLRLLAFSGIRKGEALALTWEDIDFLTNEIKINKALSRGSNNNLYIKSTKTKTNRNIKMDLGTMTVLKNWKEIQSEFLNNRNNHPKQLVFNNKDNQFLQPTKTRKWIQQVQKKYNLKPITTHGLRHTHCSLLFEAGASIKEVQDRLGHSDVATTMNIYAHVSEKAKEGTINKFITFLEE